MPLIVLPTSAHRCDCGKRLAPNAKAAARMGLPSFASSTVTCECGARVIDESPAAERAAAPAAPAVCQCCGVNEPSVKVEVTRNVWREWCLDCVEERDSVVAERFGDYLAQPGA